jgi:general secretion pathway protein G
VRPDRLWRRPRAARQRGWTLIEMVVVVSMIMILAGMAVAGYRNAVTRAQEAVLKEDLFRMRDAIDQYYADKGGYPADLQTLVTDGYLRSIPEDPFTQSAETWQVVQAEPDANNSSIEPGVFDVKSGSDKVATDGKPYAEW